MNDVKLNIKDVSEHLDEIIQKIDNTRDYVRVAHELINSCIEIEAFDKVPLELRTAIDLLMKIVSDLEYYDVSLTEDKKILEGKYHKRPVSYEEYISKDYLEEHLKEALDHERQ